MKILISNASEQPIYEQILCQIKVAIIQGELKEGEILPSIRNLAKEVGVSVITTKRAYEELEKEGFVETVKGKGTFVAAQNKELLREKKIKIIEEKLNEVIEDSKLLDISYEEILEILKILYFQ
ncbi:GntR family transcriptional regulator [Clostridium botulinum]|uniref:GntR-family transcriptional regulator n=1 Tax=Clostridium botulinum (strain Hall / ATCC 3502 / NCTC 13319 / Type A) TaxID=441771 RepID=A5I601_CLOBH|nr:GntR family transcriptional regulator [Clostridium botulinum]EPS47871.1 GntR family transcriptional regulator [Clostridium botulinum CFSAN002369]ABS33830.1 transcriptional regulator, GntR family [Clostridium botulinum A str. ATCC 19397]ABS36697.1 transcriptional regulator, GntR family [Clostridium botulinum A str. Hall]APQ71783.1 bacterial regulatory s, gntR family protein [Clostridium botulinum]AUM88894.1 GntR family transcriptional regulator [Clostridium botulinum]